MKRIETLLNLEIGLCAQSIGSAAVECGARDRMLARGVEDVDDYLQLLRHDATERRALVEEIVVSETWFFRDEDVFRVLTRYVGGDWEKAHPGCILRVLSIPCATGEEAYSTSITLLEAGLLPARYAIRAVDVSTRALRTAKLGVFGKNSFRGVSTAERQSYFQAKDGGQSVVAEARSAIDFSQGNVLDPFLATAASMNVIFCRNLLIYLDRPARTRALDNIHSWLVDDGIVFAGHAEAIETMDPRFQRTAESGHFGYVKRKAPHAPVDASRAAPARPRAAQKLMKAAPAARKSLDFKPPASAAIPSLSHAKQLADQGNLELALSACESHLRHAGPSAEAFCLMGVLRIATGETERAMECFNKAVYLEPTHYTALSHLALACDRRGDTASASNFRRRADQALRRGGP